MILDVARGSFIIFFGGGKLEVLSSDFAVKRHGFTLLRCLILGKNTCISHISGLRGPQ